MKKILFITLSNIGDAVMTTPVLERLHQLYPDAIIDLVCDPRSSSLFEHCPYRGEIFLKLKKAGKKGLWQLIKQLRQKRYDLIVDLRTDGLSYLLRAKKRLSKWNSKPYGPHAVEDLISIIDRINPDKRIPACKLWLGNDETQLAEDLLAPLADNRHLIIGPGANWQPKVWPSENFAIVANDMESVIDNVILLGGPGDQLYCESVAESLELPTLNLCGKTDLLTSLSIMQKARLFIGNDSGLGHLAAAADIPSISIFGPGRPKRYHPWSDKNQYFSGENQSFNGINSQKVITAAKALIAN